MQGPQGPKICGRLTMESPQISGGIENAEIEKPWGEGSVSPKNSTARSN